MQTLNPFITRMLCSVAASSAWAVLCLNLGGCGEDPILLAEGLAANAQPSSAPATGDTSDGDDPSTPPGQTDEPAADDSGEAEEEPVDPLEQQALDILEQHCGACHHTAPGVGSAGIDDITDVDDMIRTGNIVPGDREQSRIYVRMALGTMPPFNSGFYAPTVEEIEVVGQFIDSL